MLSGKVDATLGAFWNYEGADLARRGRKPVDPAHGEARRADLRRARLRRARRDLDEDFGARLRRFMQATARGHATLKADPRPGSTACSRPTGLDRGLQEAAVKATLPVFFPAGGERPFGYQDAAEWQRYADWMLEQGLIKRRQTAEQVVTNEFLAGEGLDPGTISQD